MVLSSHPEIPYPDEVVSAIRDARFLVRSHMAENDNEVVGLILSDGSTIHLINQARSPHRFTISQKQLLEAIVQINPDEYSVVAFYHSHPGGSPNLSLDDQASMRENWLMGLPVPWVVITDTTYRLWWLDEYSTFQHADLRELATSCIP